MTSLAIVRPYDSLKVSSRCIKTMSWALYVVYLSPAGGVLTGPYGFKVLYGFRYGMPLQSLKPYGVRRTG